MDDVTVPATNTDQQNIDDLLSGPTSTGSAANSGGVGSLLDIMADPAPQTMI